MRWFVLVLAGCGRLSFDAVSDANSLACTDPIGHDEDGDGIDDSCDVCPHVSDVTQVDGDGDRVGNACDPNPSTPTERIAYFDPFVSARPEWVQLGNVAPSYTGDQIMVDATAGRLAMGKTGAAQVAVYELAVRVEQPSATFPRQLALIAHAGPTRLIYCELYDPGTTESFFNVSYSPDNVNFSPLTGTAAPLLVAGDFAIAMHSNLPDVACTTTWPAQPPQIAASAPGGPFTATDVSFAAQGARWRVDYFIQIHTQ